MKKIIIIATAVILVLIAVPKRAEAAVITGDEPVGGVSYYLDKYIKAGGDPRDLIAAYDISADDKEVLCRIVEAEVTGAGDEAYYRAKTNVASCVLTRLDKGWGKTVRDIVFAHSGETYQFSPIKDGRYYTVEITQQTRDAVQEVIRYGPKHDCEYFCTRTCDSYVSGFHSKLRKIFSDCAHTYFKEK